MALDTLTITKSRYENLVTNFPNSLNAFSLGNESFPKEAVQKNLGGTDWDNCIYQ